MRLRAVLAFSLFPALALGAYACDDGTFASPLPVYESDGGQGFVSEDSSAAGDGPTFADVQVGDGGLVDGDAGHAADSGDAGSATDGDAAGQLDAADGGDANAALDAADGSG